MGRGAAVVGICLVVSLAFAGCFEKGGQSVDPAPTEGPPRDGGPVVLFDELGARDCVTVDAWLAAEMDHVQAFLPPPFVALDHPDLPGHTRLLLDTTYCFDGPNGIVNRQVLSAAVSPPPVPGVIAEHDAANRTYGEYATEHRHVYMLAAHVADTRWAHALHQAGVPFTVGPTQIDFTWGAFTVESTADGTEVMDGTGTLLRGAPALPMTTYWRQTEVGVQLIEELRFDGEGEAVFRVPGPGSCTLGEDTEYAYVVEGTQCGLVDYALAVTDSIAARGYWFHDLSLA